MELKDLILTPFYLILIIGIASWYRNKYYRDSPLKPYFLPGLYLKIIGAILSGMVYYFYYRYGDTIGFFKRSQILTEILYKDPVQYWKIMWADTTVYHYDIGWILHNMKAWDTSSFMITKIASVINVFTFSTYTPNALFFAFFSFLGMWKLFELITDLYPNVVREAAIACFFIPSVFFWGSGIFKDTVTLALIGYSVFFTYSLFIQRRRILRNLFWLIICLYLLAVIKTYVILSLLPALLLWIILLYRAKIKNLALRSISTPLLLVFTLLIGLFFLNKIGEQFQHWSLDQVEKRAQDMQIWHTTVVEIYGDEGGGGSFYSLGEIEYTTTGYLRVFPKAIIVTLFRPFLWEVKNVIMFFASIESLLILILFISVFIKVRPVRFFKTIFNDPTLIFFFFFSIIFAFGVGFTSYNFGALVRYKIPCLPFFVVGLYIIRAKYLVSKQTIPSGPIHQNKLEVVPRIKI